MQDVLRTYAEERIKQGTAPVSHGWCTGAQALTLLHRLASGPDSASDALKLMHELQVHQVELDLQKEQAEHERRQLTEDLTNCAALFDLAPFAYLTLEANGRVIAANRLAAQWLAPESGEESAWAGRPIADLLAPECHAAVRHLLAALGRGEGRQSCAVRSLAGGATGHAVATAKPDGGPVLMALVCAS